MAKVHIFEMADLKNTVTVVYHIPVPVENNGANIALKICVLQYLLRSGPITSLVPNIATDYTEEWAQIQAGEVYELQKTLDLDGKWNLAQRAAYVDSNYQNSVASVQNYIRNTLNFWGAVRNPA